MIKKIIFDSIETLIRDPIWTQARSFVDDLRSNVEESIFQFVREQTREMNNK